MTNTERNVCIKDVKIYRSRIFTYKSINSVDVVAFVFGFVKGKLIF
jgi:hypothetical protein